MKKTIIAVLLSLFCLAASAQERVSTLDEAVMRALLVGRVLVPETVYLQFDNSAYYLGETIWFKAFVTSGDDNRPTEFSRVLYVELLSPEGYVVKTEKYKLDDNGTCVGEFYMDPLYLSGYFEVRAYTRYMRNWCDEALFSRVFPVYNKVGANDWGHKEMLDRRRAFLKNGRWTTEEDNERALRFYPEGGNLVAGLPARVAYEVQGVRGVESCDTVTLYADGKVLLRTAPQYMGKGVFSFTPQRGVKYSAEVRVEDEEGKKKMYKYSLPKTEENGVALSVSVSDSSVNISVANNWIADDVLGFAVVHRSSVGFYRKISAEENSFSIPTASLFEGVNRAIVFAGNVPLAERLFFVEHSTLQAGDLQRVKLDVAADNLPLNRFEPRPHQKVNLTVQRADGVPIGDAADFTLSVGDNAGAERTSWSYNRYSYLLLGSEVKGYIPDVAQYFDASNPRRKEHLDLVMLTNGWTAYDWGKLAAPTLGGLAEPEKELTLAGTFYMRSKRLRLNQVASVSVKAQPYNLVRFDASYEGNKIYTSAFRTDRNGAFRLALRDFKGRRVMALSPQTKIKHSSSVNYTFVLDKYFSPSPRFLSYWERTTGSPYYNAAGFEMPLRSSVNEYIMLSDVEVEAKKHHNRFEVPPISELHLNYLDEWEYAMDVHYFKGLNSKSFSDSIEIEKEMEGYYGFQEEEGEHKDFIPEQMTATQKMRGQLFYFKDVLTASDVVKSAFHRYGLSHSYWVQNTVVKGEYHKDSALVVDEEYIHGIHPEKMTNFESFVITSDFKKRKFFEGGDGEAFWEFKGFAYANKGAHAMFYDGFLTLQHIAILGSERADYFVRNLQSMSGDAFGKKTYVRPRFPNRVACFIPYKEDAVREGIIPDLSYSTSTRRYTSVQGYSDSKRFYSPDYSTPPVEKDYRRTLLWAPSVKAVDGKLQLSFYNSTHCDAIVVDVEGREGSIFYSNDSRQSTKLYAVATGLAERVDSLKMRIEDMILELQKKKLLKDSIFWAQCDEAFRKAEIYFGLQKYSKGLTTYIELSQFGYPAAYMRIAQYYKEGYGLKKNLPLAFDFMQRAADKGNARAQYELALMFRDGVGAEANDDAAMYWLEKAVEGGEPEAMLCLGKLCLESPAVLDSVRGGELLRGASIKNNAEALYRYAVYMLAAGVENDSLLGSPNACIERSAELGGGDAQAWLMDAADARGDYKEAYKIAYKLHLNKNHRGTKYVADCLRAGRAVRRNKRLAKDLYRDAARAGNADAARILKEW